MKTEIKKVSPEELVLRRELDSYGEKLEAIKCTKDTRLQMLRMVRATDTTEEKALKYLDKYRSMRSHASRSFYFSFSQQVEAIRVCRESLDYFGITYPELPESIKGLFEGDDSVQGENRGA